MRPELVTRKAFNFGLATNPFLAILFLIELALIVVYSSEESGSVSEILHSFIKVLFTVLLLAFFFGKVITEVAWDSVDV